MKFYSSFLTILSVFILCTSCSEHDVIDDNTEPEIVYDATFSLAVNRNEEVKSKAADNKALTIMNNNPNFIGKLALAVFQNDKLVAFKEEKDAENGVYKIEEVEVPSGNVKVVLLANVNVDIEYQKKGTELSKYQEMSVHLENEINGSLSMSSGFLNYSFSPGHNYIGYSDSRGEISVDHDGTLIVGSELAGEKIKMIRNVSRVSINVLYLKPKKEYEGVDKVTFQIKDFFAANVKSESKLILDKNGSVEMDKTGSDFWWCGNFHDAMGALKTEEASKVDMLNYDVTNPPANFDEMNEHYPFLNNDIVVCYGNIFGRDEKNNMIISKMITYDPAVDYTNIGYPHIEAYGPTIPLGTYFHIYENKDLGNNRKLFVVKGDYTYYSEEGQKKVWKDRYYTVIVNKDNLGKADHEYIKHNYIYDINLTIAGPGSETPYDPQSSADISVKINVKDWDVVDQNASLE